RCKALKTRGKMKKSRGGCRNSFFVSIRKAPLQKYATDTNRHEKVQTPILGIEALRTIGRIVRPVKVRIDLANGQHNPKDIQDSAAGDASSAPPTCPVGGQDHETSE